MSQSIKELYEFSHFRLDVSERLLLRDGKRVALTDKAFDTLCVLVGRAGELVSKDELMNEVWTDSIVEENNLDQKISMIRQALGERGRGKEKFIETVRGRGYRFLPPVRRVEAEVSEPPIESQDFQAPFSEPQIPNPKSQIPNRYEMQRTGNVVRLAKWRHETDEVEAYPDEENAAPETVSSVEKPAEPAADSEFLGFRQPKKRLVVIAAASILVIALAVFALYRLIPTQPPTAGAPIDSIAVLPFVNESGNADTEYLSDGMTESLIGSLSQVPNLNVKARSSVFHYKGKNVRAQTVGSELSVQAVLMGRVVERGDRLTLSLELVDAGTENVIWSERYDRQQTELLTLQSEIARDVSRKLRARLSGADEKRVTKTHTADPEAYELYLQGLYHWNKRTLQDLRRSIELFGQAIDKDPAYAKAYAGLAMGYLVFQGYGKNLTNQEKNELSSKRRAATLRARELDDSLPEVHALLASIYEDEWNFAAAENEHRRAIELDPNFASAHQFYAYHLSLRGRHEEALASISRARELDPLSRSIAFSVGASLAGARRYDEAIAQFKKVLEMEPNHPLSHLLLAQVYDVKGMYAEAIAEYQTADVLLEKETPETAKRKAAALTQALKIGAAYGYWQKRLEFSQEDHDKDTGTAYTIAVNYARLGDRERAFENLEKSLALREDDLLFIKNEPAFDEMRADARFRDLLRRTGLSE